MVALWTRTVAVDTVTFDPRPRGRRGRLTAGPRCGGPVRPPRNARPARRSGEFRATAPAGPGDARAPRSQRHVPQLYTLSVDEARAADLASIQAAGGDAEPVAEVADRAIPGPDGPLPIRIYRPALGGALPVLVYFFGGGWTLGSIDTSDGDLPQPGQRRRLPGRRRRLPARAGAQVPGRGARLPRRGPLGRRARRRASARTRPGSPSAATARAATWPPRSPCWPATTAPAAGRSAAGLPEHRLPLATPPRCATATTRTCSTTPRSPGTGTTTWPTPPTASTRSPRRCAPRPSPACRRRW